MANYKEKILIVAEPDDDIKQSIQLYQEVFDIPNPLSKIKLHSTILIDNNPLPPEMEELHEKKINIRCRTDYLKIGEYRNKRVLTLRFKSSGLMSLRKKIINRYDVLRGKKSFNFYPHITISYDIGDVKKSDIDDLTLFPKNFKLTLMYLGYKRFNSFSR